jgi:hypothetical protein
VPGELIEAGLADFDALLAAVREHDVVVAQRLPPQLLRYVARLPCGSWPTSTTRR